MTISTTYNTYVYQIDGNGNVIGRTSYDFDNNGNLTKTYEEGSFPEAAAKAAKAADNEKYMTINGLTLPLKDITELMKNSIVPIDPPSYMIAPIFMLPSGNLTLIPQDYYDWSEQPEYCNSYEDYQNRWANMGIDYEASCFDVTHALEFNEISREQYKKGFDGMSDEEIYRAIYEKYQYCYGENFLDAEAVAYPIGSLANDRYNKVIKNFKSEIEALFDGDKTGKIRKKALYGDKNDADVISDIIEKYKENGTVTHAGLHKIANEADKCGIGGGLRNALLFTRDFLYGKTIFDDNIGNREKLMNKPVTTDFIKEVERMTTDHAKKGFGYYAAGDMITVLEAIANEL